MIRPFTLITMLLAAGSGAYLFGVKHRAQTLDDQLAGVNQKILLDAQRITVLQAQWALETDPTRLSGLARQFSPLQPMKPAQLVTLAALRDELPPPDSPAPAGAAPASAAAPQLVASPALVPPAVTAPSLPLPPPIAPVRVAVDGSSPVRPAHPVSHSLLHLAGTKSAETLPPPRIIAPQSPPASQLAPQFVAMKAAPIDTGSVLGMAADLAPPRPLPQGIGN